MSVAAPLTGKPSLLAPLRGRDFRLFWAGFTASLFADQLSLVGLAWLSLQLTGSPLATGGVLTAAALPRGALGLLGGAVADRFGARRIGVLSAAARVLCMGVLAGIVLSGRARMSEVYALAFAFGAVDAFYGPTRASLLPRTVGVDELDAATGLEGSTQALASLVGPAVAGLLVAKAGTGYALAGDALLYVAVAIATAGLRVGEARGPGEPGEAPTTVWGDIRSGLGYVFGDPVVTSLLILATAITLAVIGPVDVGLAALARGHLGGAVALGATLAGFGAGSLIGSLLAGSLPAGRVLPRLLVVAGVFAVGMPLLGVAPNLVVAVALTVAMGVASGAINVIATAWLMRRTDPSMMGRVFSLVMVTQVAGNPVSLAAAGAIAQVSVPLVFAGSGALIALCVVGGTLWLRTQASSLDW